MLVKQDPVTKLWCREDGKVLMPPCPSIHRFTYEWVAGWPSSKLGYLVIRHQRKNHQVHRILARAFLPNPGNLPTVDHIDRNPRNNRVDNLRWADYKTQNDNHGNVINRVDYGARACEDRKVYNAAYKAAHKAERKEYNSALCAPLPDFGVNEFINAIVKPRTRRMAGAIDRYCVDMEKTAMQVAIVFDSRAVYVAEWTETVEVKTPERRGMQWEMHFMAYPYRLRSWAFKRIQGNGGHVRIIDFKGLINMPLDEFSAIRSENKETAEKLRRHFHGNMQMSGGTMHDRLY